MSVAVVPLLTSIHCLTHFSLDNGTLAYTQSLFFYSLCVHSVTSSAGYGFLPTVQGVYVEIPDPNVTSI